MSELISGKEALIALANGEEVEFYHNNCWSWVGEMIIIKHFVDDSFQFRIKPRTITINGIEIPAPFKPKDGDTVFVPSNFIQQGYLECKYPTFENRVFQFGVWRTEEEIKQVVAALHEVFK